jgi:hypothetical protein
MGADILRRTSRAGAGLFALALLIGALPGTTLAQSTPASGQPPNAAAAGSPPEALLPEPRIIDRTITFAEQTLRIGEGGQPKNGFYPELSNMVTGSGWISLGPGYRHTLFGDRAFVDASTALSWRSYKMAQARFELTTLADGHVVLGSQARWQDLTQVTFFGEGADAPEASRSEYRIKSTNIVGYTTVRPATWLSIGGRVGWLDRPSILAPAGSFKRGNPDAKEMFPEDIVYAVPEQPRFTHGELSIAADTRDHRSHPTRGGLYRGAWSRYSDRDSGTFSFHRYEAEGAQFLPVADARVVFALHGWLVASDTAAGEVIPFYLMPGLGGHNTLRAYTDYRFHDRNLIIVTAESRVALFTHLDAALFVDAGNVAARVADLNLDKRGYGAGLRLHTTDATFARFDVAHGAEGWRLLLRLNDPLHLSRLSKRTAVVPFVP